MGKRTVFIGCMLAVSATGATAQARGARQLTEAAIQAMQDTVKLTGLQSVRLEGMQHEFMLGNAERAEGPWRTTYSQFVELRDLTNTRLRRTEQMTRPGATSPFLITILTDSVVAGRVGAREVGSNITNFEDTIDRLEASPERVLLLAAAAPALVLDAPVTRYGRSFDVVSFPWRNGRMRIELQRETHFPAAVDIVREYPHNFRWAPFGRVTMRHEYVNWTVQPSGIWWPMQHKVYFNGEPLRDVSIARVALDLAPAPADSFTVGDSARLQYAASSRTTFASFTLGLRGPPSELRPGILRIPDFWTMHLIKQDDGVVILEAHVSGPYLKQVIAEAGKRYPGSPIKAIVLTSDPWAHAGGVRAAAGRGIPIYANQRSIPFFSSLAKGIKTARFIPVTGKTVIGSGSNRIELYPVGGEYGQRMLMAYLPTQKLLYGSDLVFPNRGTDGSTQAGFLATPAHDLRNAVTRERLDVDALFCVQNYPLYDWHAFMRNELKPATTAAAKGEP